jgi:hypothetical protein
VWAGTAAGVLGLTGQVDPEVYRNRFGKLIAPTGERLYSAVRSGAALDLSALDSATQRAWRNTLCLSGFWRRQPEGLGKKPTKSQSRG